MTPKSRLGRSTFESDNPPQLHSLIQVICHSVFHLAIFDSPGSWAGSFTRNASPELKEQVRGRAPFPRTFSLSLRPILLASASLTWTILTDVLYLRFGGEIKSFRKNLQQLLAIIEHANSQRPQRPWRDPDDECQTALQPVSEAVGPFRKTLKECEQLLNDNERFQRDQAGFVDNVIWHMSTQRDVDVLRERIHFHSTKVTFVSSFGKEMQSRLIEAATNLDQAIRDVGLSVSSTLPLPKCVY